MRTRLASCGLLVASVFSSPQLDAQSAIDPNQLLANANHAFAGALSVSSVTLTGEATRTVGSTNETGQITLVAKSDGSSSIQVTLGSGNRTESQNTFANGQSCTWSGTDGIAHQAPAHNCMLSAAWFLPEVAIFSPLRPSNGAFTASVGSTGTEDLLHWTRTQNIDPTNAPAFLSQLGAFYLEIDASAFLPTSLGYTLHPDSNVGVSVPVVVLYSEYRTVNGVAIPYHIQRYSNGVLVLDISMSSVAVTYDIGEFTDEPACSICSLPNNFVICLKGILFGSGHWDL